MCWKRQGVIDGKSAWTSRARTGAAAWDSDVRVAGEEGAALKKVVLRYLASESETFPS